MASRERLEIVRSCDWPMHHGGANNPHGGLWGQLTEIRVDGVTAYVREHFRTDHFHMPGNARIGMKKGRMPAGARLVLELAAPAERWDAIAAVVRVKDPKGRPVERNRLFTAAWAEHRLREAHA
ncbi:MAG: hypothetical protein KF878_00290 [Planctomycetes bacterium]|nr:hypothetical protein [Planctomycetota bacterium]